MPVDVGRHSSVQTSILDIFPWDHSVTFYPHIALDCPCPWSTLLACSCVSFHLSRGLFFAPQTFIPCLSFHLSRGLFCASNIYPLSFFPFVVMFSLCLSFHLSPDLFLTLFSFICWSSSASFPVPLCCRCDIFQPSPFHCISKEY